MWSLFPVPDRESFEKPLEFSEGRRVSLLCQRGDSGWPLDCFRMGVTGKANQAIRGLELFQPPDPQGGDSEGQSGRET